MGRMLDSELEDPSPNPSSAQVSMTLGTLFNISRPQLAHL